LATKPALEEARIYFLAKSAVENSADPSDALVVLLSGPLSQLHGQIFEPQKLSELAKTYYGWTISAAAIDFLTDRLRRNGWLDSRSDFPSRGPFYVNLPDPLVDDTQSETLADLNRLGIALQTFAHELSPINALPNDAEEAAGLLLRYAINANAANGETIENSDGDYICGRFIEHIETRDGDLANLLASLSSLGFLSIISQDFSAPKSARKSSLKIVVDGPILLDYLECSGRLRAKASKELFADLQSMGCEIATFNHCVREASVALRSVLRTDRADRYGPTGDALRRGVVREDVLKGILQNFDVAVRQAGIKILPDNIETNPETHQFFNDDQAANLEEIINWHDAENDAARLADADTVTLTIRRRRGFRTTDLFESRFVTVTTNSTYCGAVRRYLTDTFYYNCGQIPPVISLQELSAKVWLEIGENNKKRLSLASGHLLLACERSVRLNPAVVERAKEELATADPEKLEQFERLLSVPRSARAIVDRTLNNITNITGESIGSLVEAAIYAAGEEVAQREAQRRDELIAIHSELLGQKDSELDDERLRRESAEGRFGSERARAAQVDSDIAQSLASEASERFRKRLGQIRAFGLVVAIVPLAIVLLRYNEVPVPMWQLALLSLVMIAALLTAMNFPGQWLTGVLRSKSVDWSERELRRIGRGDLAERATFQWGENNLEIDLAERPD
jgi:hypothetical protein